MFGFVNATEISNEIWGFYFILVNKCWFVPIENMTLVIYIGLMQKC